jgi:hypothetical protein
LGLLPPLALPRLTVLGACGRPKEIPSLGLFHDFLKSGEFQPPQKAVYEYCAHFLEKMMSGE